MVTKIGSIKKESEKDKKQSSLLSHFVKRKTEDKEDVGVAVKKSNGVEKEKVSEEIFLEWSQLIPAEWLEIVKDELGKPYFANLAAFLSSEWQNSSYQVYPPKHQIYSWAAACPPDKIKVVILGQDPYHGDGQAHGLAFSVPPGKRPLPPSLVNIFTELENDLGTGELDKTNGSLMGWAQQGVLLLNASLTVRAHQAASHANRGWEVSELIIGLYLFLAIYRIDY